MSPYQLSEALEESFYDPFSENLHYRTIGMLDSYGYGDVTFFLLLEKRPQGMLPNITISLQCYV